MEIQVQAQAEVASLSRSLDSQKMVGEVITQTLDRMNTSSGMAPKVASDSDLQKSVFSAAHAAVGKGTKLNIEV